MHLSISKEFTFSEEEISKWKDKTNNFEGPPLGKLKTENDTYSSYFHQCRAATSRTQFIGRKGVDALPNYLRWLELITPIFRIPEGTVRLKLSDKAQFHFIWRPSSDWNAYERINSMQVCMLITEPWGDFFLRRFFEYYDKGEFTFMECVELVCYECRKIAYNAEEFRMFTYRFPFGNSLNGTPYFNKDITAEYIKDSYVATPLATGKFPGYIFYREPGNLSEKERLVQYGYEQLLIVLMTNTKLVKRNDLNTVYTFPDKLEITADEFKPSTSCHCNSLRHPAFADMPQALCGHEKIKLVFNNVEEVRELVSRNKKGIKTTLKDAGIRPHIYPLITNLV